MNMNNKNDHERKNNKVDKDIKKTSNSDYEELSHEAEKERSKKPGSQSNSSKQHNNGRGGGK